jgi:hypothetical protein
MEHVISQGIKETLPGNYQKVAVKFHVSILKCELWDFVPVFQYEMICNLYAASCGLYHCLMVRNSFLSFCQAEQASEAFQKFLISHTGQCLKKNHNDTILLSQTFRATWY